MTFYDGDHLNKTNLQETNLHRGSIRFKVKKDYKNSINSFDYRSGSMIMFRAKKDARSRYLFHLQGSYQRKDQSSRL